MLALRAVWWIVLIGNVSLAIALLVSMALRRRRGDPLLSGPMLLMASVLMALLAAGILWTLIKP